MTALDEIAAETGTSGRTLRRAAARGLIRCRRLSPRRVVVEPRERRYLLRHWPLLRTLLAVLRTEPQVRLAVLFGSAARGDGHARSDIDLLVGLRTREPLLVARLAGRLTEELGRAVHLVALADAERSPLLLADVLREGRVLADRDGDWSELRRRERSTLRRAVHAEAELERAAWDTLESVAS